METYGDSSQFVPKAYGEPGHPPKSRFSVLRGHHAVENTVTSVCRTFGARDAPGREGEWVPYIGGGLQ